MITTFSFWVNSPFKISFNALLKDIVCVSAARAVFLIEALFLKIFGRIADSQPAPMGLNILFWAGAETETKVVHGTEPPVKDPHVTAVERKITARQMTDQRPARAKFNVHWQVQVLWWWIHLRQYCRIAGHVRFAFSQWTLCRIWPCFSGQGILLLWRHSEYRAKALYKDRLMGDGRDLTGKLQKCYVCNFIQVLHVDPIMQIACHKPWTKNNAWIASFFSFYFI